LRPLRRDGREPSRLLELKMKQSLHRTQIRECALGSLTGGVTRAAEQRQTEPVEVLHPFGEIAAVLHAASDRQENHRQTAVAEGALQGATPSPATRLFALPFLLLELIVVSIIAGRTVVVFGALRTMKPPVIPSPAIAVLPVLVAVDVAESPGVVLLIPASPTALIPVVVFVGSVVPSPAIAGPPVLVAIAVAELPCIVLLNPLALASLIPVVMIGSDQAGRQNKRTDQYHNRC
jgi:hypothetical protein